ncbi:hypothetical protein QLH52_15195 [Methylomonas sp. OY6]|uniref:Small metal-binding protein n=1 Tax=Methylomonas defluvii TaxID=3045149 RepID=A0ABU4UIT0_9GAMM|nr:hypothetical protein [Methylomonas sp. OY6]MDX8128639.1 hypothetical protein [Methylomonas sp. OY6]
MKLFTKAVLTLSFAASLSLVNVCAFAAEEAPVAAAQSGAAGIIAHIEKALVEVSKSDFSAAQIHLKAARTSSEAIADTSEAAKKAHASLMQGQIQSKAGNVAKATEELTKTIELYKAL